MQYVIKVWMIGKVENEAAAKRICRNLSIERERDGLPADKTSGYKGSKVSNNGVSFI
jgi:hypothetical protein